MTSTDPYDLKDNSEALLDLATDAVRYAVDQDEAMPVDPNVFPAPLRLDGASFVTLKKAGDLRGCIGSLKAHEPLVINIADNAHGAVARDTRFPAVSKEELPDIAVSLSILGPLNTMRYSAESDLLTQLRPHVDGLVLADSNGRRSTFLPQVWEDLPESEAFLNALKRKGGFDPGPLSGDVKVWRYKVTDVGPKPVIHR